MVILILLSILPFICCDWESEWLIPVRDSYRETPGNTDKRKFKIFGDEPLGLTPAYEDFRQQDLTKNKDMIYGVLSSETVTTSLTEKLKNTLESAAVLAETLKNQIFLVASREKFLKETIANGRSGVTVLTLALMGKLPRTYIIRDGFWTLCNGIVQQPTNGLGPANIFNELFAAPRCIGQEVVSRPDPCVFHSIVKYETIPSRRSVVYSEEDYLCLKPTFNQTLEQYFSIPKYVVNDTCKDGLVRSLTDNTRECGLRVLCEYTYYPHNAANTNLPLEYCTEKDGSCKLIVAWHISNSTIENFEYLKNDQAFKKFFMNIDYYEDNTML